MIRLNIGAGKTKVAGFIAVDAYNPLADVIMPAHATGYARNSVDEIMSSHMIEHLDGGILHEAIAHWHTILRTGAKVTVLVPNAKLYLQEWIEAEERGDNEHIEQWGSRWIVGWENKGEGMWHRHLFTPQTLRRLFEKVGFKVQVCTVVETRVKNKKHFEYRKYGDIKCIAIKL